MLLNNFRFSAGGATLGAFLFLASTASAQVKIGGKDLQIHGFMQQGFAVSNNNNFLTMKTNSGSFSMSDGGVNLSMKVTPKLRIGAQAFSRNIGDLGNGKVQLDWAFADYKFNDWIGVRGGKVKTQLGLFTDTQDMEFIHTFALLPQSIYPTDLRATTIAHTGGDVYGDVSLRKAGRLSYVLYGGNRADDPRGGYYLGTKDANAPLTRYRSWVYGSDLRWNTPVEGLLFGYSRFIAGGYGNARLLALGGQRLPIPGGIPFRFDLTNANVSAFYGDFQRGRFRTYSELWYSDTDSRFSGIPVAPLVQRNRSWYVAASYRVHPKVELGGYYTDFRVDRRRGFAANNGIRGPVVSARFDLTKYWNVKVENHFIDGFADPLSSRTFYPSSNPQGLKPRTNVFLLRTGFAF
jgi:hypothetical protein